MSAKTKKILLIEDDVFLVRVYGKFLEREGYEVVILETGTNAVSVAKSEKPDLIILDIIMPETDGFDALQMLKEDDLTKKIPVMVLTNLSTDEDKKKALDMGAEKYLVKANMSFKEVIAEVKKFV